MIFLNLGSIILGIASLLLPIQSVKEFKNGKHNLSEIFVHGSYITAIISISFQIMYQNYLVDSNNWSALMDTSRALVKVVILYSIAIIIVNTMIYRAKKKL